MLRFCFISILFCICGFSLAQSIKATYSPVAGIDGYQTLQLYGQIDDKPYGRLMYYDKKGSSKDADYMICFEDAAKNKISREPFSIPALPGYVKNGDINLLNISVMKEYILMVISFETGRHEVGIAAYTLDPETLKAIGDAHLMGKFADHIGEAYITDHAENHVVLSSDSSCLVLTNEQYTFDPGDSHPEERKINLSVNVYDAVSFEKLSESKFPKELDATRYSLQLADVFNKNNICIIYNRKIWRHTDFRKNAVRETHHYGGPGVIDQYIYTGTGGAASFEVNKRVLHKPGMMLMSQSAKAVKNELLLVSYYRDSLLIGKKDFMTIPLFEITCLKATDMSEMSKRILKATPAQCTLLMPYEKNFTKNLATLEAEDTRSIVIRDIERTASGHWIIATASSIRSDNFSNLRCIMLMNYFPAGADDSWLRVIPCGQVGTGYLGVGYNLFVSGENILMLMNDLKKNMQTLTDLNDFVNTAHSAGMNYSATNEKMKYEYYDRASHDYTVRLDKIDPAGKVAHYFVTNFPEEREYLPYPEISWMSSDNIIHYLGLHKYELNKYKAFDIAGINVNDVIGE